MKKSDFLCWKNSKWGGGGKNSFSVAVTHKNVYKRHCYKKYSHFCIMHN